MANFVATVVTPREPGDALDFVADFENLPSWDPGIEQVERLDAGPLAVGARYAAQLRSPRMNLVYEVIEYAPGERAVLRAETRRLVSHDVITVEPTDGATQLTYDATLTMTGIFRLLDPLLGIGFNRVAERAVDGLVVALDGARAS